MPRPRSKFPTELELLILNILWDHGVQPVRVIRDLLADSAGRDLAHTSVVTTLNKMVEKGYLIREQEGNAYIFGPAVERESISTGILNDVLNRVFDGSAKSMILSLLSSEKITQEEQQEIQLLIEQSNNQD